MIQPRHATYTARFNRLPAIVRGAALMTGSGMSFALMMVLVRHVSASVHPFEAAFFRNLFGLALMMPWLLRSGVKALIVVPGQKRVLRCLAPPGRLPGRMRAAKSGMHPDDGIL